MSRHGTAANRPTDRHVALCRDFQSAGGVIYVEALSAVDLPHPPMVPWGRMDLRRVACGALEREVNHTLAIMNGAQAPPQRMDIRYDVFENAFRYIADLGYRAFVARDKQGSLCGIASSTWAPEGDPAWGRPTRGWTVQLNNVATFNAPRGSGAALVAAVAVSDHQPSQNVEVGVAANAIPWYESIGFVHDGTYSGSLPVPKMVLGPAQISALAQSLRRETPNLMRTLNDFCLD